MTPAARVAAAIEVLDDILTGSAPEKALRGWGRKHRFAGSKDRAAIRDHVFQALRCRASYAWIGGAETGRGIMIGAMRDAGLLDDMFTGDGHAPAPVLPDEKGAEITTAPRNIRLDMPAWLLPHFDEALAELSDDTLMQLRTRAGVFLRVNTARATVADAIDALAKDGIVSHSVNHIKAALHITENERKISLSDAYLGGLVELQDPSSQLAIDRLDLQHGMRVLDLCAGGGGKALALAALGAKVTAHDIDPRRMTDLPKRAARAGAQIDTVSTADLSKCDPFDLVLCDAPCSGSGTWRRTPMAKWDLTPERLDALTIIQDDVLRQAAPMLRAGGYLAYATCSVFCVENQGRVDTFLQSNKDFHAVDEMSIAPHTQGDGFFLSVMKQS